MARQRAARAPRARVVGALTCLQAAPAGALVPAPAAGPTSGPGAQYMVTAVPGALGGLTSDLARDGVPVVQRFDGLGMAVVRTTPAEATRLPVAVSDPPDGHRTARRDRHR